MPTRLCVLWVALISASSAATLLAAGPDGAAEAGAEAKPDSLKKKVEDSFAKFLLQREAPVTTTDPNNKAALERLKATYDRLKAVVDLETAKLDFTPPSGPLVWKLVPRKDVVLDGAPLANARKEARELLVQFVLQEVPQFYPDLSGEDKKEEFAALKAKLEKELVAEVKGPDKPLDLAAIRVRLAAWLKANLAEERKQSEWLELVDLSAAESKCLLTYQQGAIDWTCFYTDAAVASSETRMNDDESAVSNAVKAVLGRFITQDLQQTLDPVKYEALLNASKGRSLYRVSQTFITKSWKRWLPPTEGTESFSGNQKPKSDGSGLFPVMLDSQTATSLKDVDLKLANLRFSPPFGILWNVELKPGFLANEEQIKPINAEFTTLFGTFLQEGVQNRVLARDYDGLSKNFSVSVAKRENDKDPPKVPPPAVASHYPPAYLSGPCCGVDWFGYSPWGCGCATAFPLWQSPCGCGGWSAPVSCCGLAYGSAGSYSLAGTSMRPDGSYILSPVAEARYSRPQQPAQTSAKRSDLTLTSLTETGPANSLAPYVGARSVSPQRQVNLPDFKAAPQTPEMARKWYTSGMDAYWHRDHSTALEYLTAASSIEDDARYWIFRGLAELSLNRSTDAEKSFKAGWNLVQSGRFEKQALANALERVQGRTRMRIEAVREGMGISW